MSKQNGNFKIVIFRHRFGYLWRLLHFQHFIMAFRNVSTRGAAVGDWIVIIEKMNESWVNEFGIDFELPFITQNQIEWCDEQIHLIHPFLLSLHKRAFSFPEMVANPANDANYVPLQTFLKWHDCHDLMIIFVQNCYDRHQTDQRCYVIDEWMAIKPTSNCVRNE